MPRFAPFLSKIQEKLEEAKISDLNHELGKFAQGSAAYWGNLRTDAGSYFKTGSTKFWGGTRNKAPPGGLSKSISLPTGFRSVEPRQTDNNNRDDQVQSKYKYRSSVIFEDDLQDESFEPTPRTSGLDSCSVVDRFIRVIESKDQVQPQPEQHRLKTREEIRKKLADFSDSAPKKSGSKKAADLEVCYINETAELEEDPLKDDDDDEEDYEPVETQVRVQLPQAHPAQPDPSLSEPGRFPRSKSDWEAFRNPQLACADISVPEDNQAGRYPTLSDLQAEAALALTNCQKFARRKIDAEKHRRDIEAGQALKSLIGREIGRRLSPESLNSLNLATLQVIVNNYLNRIEKLNEELVKLLLEKDELQIEQDSQLVDIDDLSQPSSRERLFF